MFVERTSHIREIKAAEARGEKASKVAGVDTASVKPTDPVYHDIQTYT